MVSVSQLLSWKPQQLGDVADELTRHRRRLADLDGEMSGARPPSSWVGADSVGAENAHRQLEADIVDAVAEVVTVINALDTAATAISTARSKLEGAIEAARGAGFEVDRETGTVTDPRTYDDEAEATESSRRVQGFVQLMADALADAADADEALAAALDSAEGGEIDVSGDLSSLSLADELDGMSTGEAATYLLDHPERGRNALDLIDPAVRQEMGRQLDDRLAELEDMDNTYEGDDLDPLVEAMQAYGSDPVIATALLGSRGPDGLVALNGTLSTLAWDDDSHSPYPMDEDIAGAIGQLQTELGNTLSAGTQGLTRDGQAGTDEHVSSDWVDQLVRAADQEVPLTIWEGGEEKQWRVHGYQLVAPLLRSADSGYLLNEVGDGMLAWEEKNGGPGAWVAPIQGEDGSIIGGRVDGTDHNYLAQGLRLDWTQGWGDADPAGYDPMGALLDGLSSNPDAARDFFTGPGLDVEHATGDEGQPWDERTPEHTSRVDYLLTDRGWPDDHPYNYEADPRSRDATGGQERLGDALVAATTDDPTGPQASGQVRDILEEMVRSVGADEQTSGHANLVENDRQTTGFDDTDWVPPRLRDDLATILGHHGDAVYGTANDDVSTDVGSDGSSVDSPEGRYGVRWDEEHLNAVLRDLGKDPVAHQTLTGSFTDAALDDVRAHEGNDAYVRTQPAETLGDLYEQIGQGRDTRIENEWQEADIEHNESVDKKAGVANFLADKVLGAGTKGANPVVGFAVNEAADQVIADWQERNQQDYTGDLGSVLRDREQMRDDLANQVIADYLRGSGGGAPGSSG